MDLDRNLVAAALPGYEIGDEIGRGGWGTVLRARHVRLGRDVAVKQLPKAFAEDQSALDRFMSEARIIGQLDHPHIVKVYDFVEKDGTWLIVMELLAGGTLWDYFRVNGMRADQACGITLAMCSALQVAHDHGILHRDLKPENILFNSEGAARLGDFGIAMEVDLDVRRTRAGEVIGTPTYMSPEQAWGRPLGPGSDIYSLGIVLYEQLAGRVPFPEAQTPVESLIQHARDLPASLTETAPEIPLPIVHVVMTALEKEPEARYPSAEAFGVALAHACNEAYGDTWLRDSGTILMGGGAIAAAALSARPSNTPKRQPTQSMPALRADHFAGETRTESGHFAGAADASATGSTPAVTPGPADVTTAPMAVGAYDTGGAPPAGPPSGPPSGPPPGPGPGPGPVSGPPPGPSGAAASTGGRKGRTAAFVAVGVFVLVVLAGAAYALTRDKGDPYGAGASTTTTSWATTTTEKSSSTTAKAIGGDATTTTEKPTTTTTEPTTTTTAGKTCPAGQRCVFVDKVELQGDAYVVTWRAVNFEPSFDLSDHFHAHLYWDTISASQAGTNAGAFGQKQGQWEIAQSSPYTGTTVLTKAGKPAPALKVCGTVGNHEHALDNPAFFDCAPIPAG